MALGRYREMPKQECIPAMAEKSQPVFNRAVSWLARCGDIQGQAGSFIAYLHGLVLTIWLGLGRHDWMRLNQNAFQEHAMFKVNMPHEMNQVFARAFNTHDIDNLMALYEENAVLRIDTEKTFTGRVAIASELRKLLLLPGKMLSHNSFCIEHGDIALLRADHSIVNTDGVTILSGSSAEVVRRQADGTWLYIIDHAMGATLPRVDV